jgi:hypothetical protein
MDDATAPPQLDAQPNLDLDANGQPITNPEDEPKKIKRSKHRLVVDDIVPTDDSPLGDNSCLFMSQAKMDELDLFRGDNVLIKGMLLYNDVVHMQCNHRCPCFLIGNSPIVLVCAPMKRVYSPKSQIGRSSQIGWYWCAQ